MACQITSESGRSNWTGADLSHGHRPQPGQPLPKKNSAAKGTCALVPPISNGDRCWLMQQPMNLDAMSGYLIQTMIISGTSLIALRTRQSMGCGPILMVSPRWSMIPLRIAAGLSSLPRLIADGNAAELEGPAIPAM